MTTTEPRTEPLATQPAGPGGDAGRRRTQREPLLSRLRARLFAFFRRFWIWLVIIIVAAVSGFGVFRLHGIFGVHGNEFGGGKVGGEIKPFNEKVLTLEVWGSGSTATISYLDENSHPVTLTNEPLPWKKEIRSTQPSLPANLVAQGTGASIKCRITLDENDGREKRETHNESDPDETVNAFTFCLDKTL